MFVKRGARGEGRGRRKNMFEEIMAENSPNLLTHNNLRIPGAPCPPSRINAD